MTRNQKRPLGLPLYTKLTYNADFQASFRHPDRVDDEKLDGKKST